MEMIGENIEEMLKSVDLRYIKKRDLCITRKKVGKGFQFFDKQGKQITDKNILERASHLAIPPAWENVQICQSPHGHIQAVGWDERGRKQYLYHEEWNKLQSQHKFNKMIFFGEVLPEIRKQIASDMKSPGLHRKRVVSTVVWLLQNTFIRVGNEEYAKENKSYGLTTLRNKHVQIEDDKVTFDFKGKSGVFHEVEINNPKVVKIIKKCIELPGYELFQYLDEDEKKKQVVDSRDVNEYLRGITGEDITAKDFRTWGGSVLAAYTLHALGPSDTKIWLKKNISTAIKNVASHLRNTCPTCRAYYVHPTVLKTYEEKKLSPHFEKTLRDKDKKPEELSLDEYATWTLIKKYPIINV